MSPWDILGQLMQTILRFVPRVWFCPSYVAGVLFVRGKNIRPFKPGMVCWWPFWTSMLTCTTVRQVMEISAQTMTTADGKSVIIAGVVVYHITDPTKYLTENFEAEHNVDEAVAACLRSVVIDRTWDEIQANNRNTTDRALTKEAGEMLDEFGITVERVRLTSFAQAKVINLIGGDTVGVVPDGGDDE